MKLNEAVRGSRVGKSILCDTRSRAADLLYERVTRSSVRNELEITSSGEKTPDQPGLRFARCRVKHDARMSWVTRADRKSFEVPERSTSKQFRSRNGQRAIIHAKGRVGSMGLGALHRTYTSPRLTLSLCSDLRPPFSVPPFRRPRRPLQLLVSIDARLESRVKRSFPISHLASTQNYELRTSREIVAKSFPRYFLCAESRAPPVEHRIATTIAQSIR